MNTLLSVLLASFVFSSFAGAADFSGSSIVDYTPEMVSFARDTAMAGFGFHKGDTNNYNVTIKPGPLKGTMKLSIAENAVEGILIVEELQLPILKTQMIETLISKQNGKILKVIVNGKEQDPPDISGVKMLSQDQTKITVPAGTYECTHVVIQDGSGQKSESWVNMLEVPVNGMIKSIQSPRNPIVLTMELTSFVRGQ